MTYLLNTFAKRMLAFSSDPEPENALNLFKVLIQSACSICVAMVFLTGCSVVPVVEPDSLNANLRSSNSSSSVFLRSEPQNSAQTPQTPIDAIGAFATAVIPSTSPPDQSPPTDLWDRMRRNFKLPALEHPLVDSHANRLRNIHYFRARVERLRLYLPLVVSEVERRNFPAELALVPLVESAMNCHAASAAAAVGCWQFLNGTARDMNLRISSLVDQRTDLLASTDAALNYLEMLHGKTGDWHLAMAAYNWGIGRVLRIADAARAKGQEVSFAALSESMPQETRNYVPQIEAFKRLILEGDADQLPDVPDQAFVVAVRLQYDIDVALAARLAGISEAQILKLNTAVRRPLILAAATPDLLLPVQSAERFAQALSAHRGPMASWRLVKTQGHATVRQLAQFHHSTEQVLRQVNNIPLGQKPGPGSAMLVPSGSLSDLHQRVDDRVVASAQQHWMPEVVRLWLKARRKDTLAAISKRIGIASANLNRWNPSVSSARPLKTGTPILVMVAPEEQASVLERAASHTKVVAKAKLRRRETTQPSVVARAASKRHSVQRS